MHYSHFFFRFYLITYAAILLGIFEIIFINQLSICNFRFLESFIHLLVYVSLNKWIEYLVLMEFVVWSQMHGSVLEEVTSKLTSMFLAAVSQRVDSLNWLK